MPATVFVLAAAIGVVGSNSLVLSPIAVRVAQSFPGASAPDVLLAAAAYGAGVALSALSLAPLIDRWGATRSLRVALFGLALAFAASAAAAGAAWLSLAQGLAGLAAGVALPAVYALSAKVAPTGRESETLGIVLTGWTLSMVIGVSGAGLVADALGWRAVFVILAVGAAAIAFAVAPRTERDGAEKAAALASGGAVSSPRLLALLRHPGAAPAFLQCAAYMAAFYGLYAYLGPHAGGTLGLSSAAVGLLTMAYGVGFAVAAPLDRMIDARGSERVALPIFLTLIAVYGALALSAGSATALVAVALVWGAANHLGLNLILMRLRALAPDRQGRVMGLYSFITYAAMFAATLLYRPLFDGAGLVGCALVSAFLVALTLPGASRARAWGAR